MGRFNDWYDYVNPVKYGEAAWDAVYGDPAQQQKDAYAAAGRASADLGNSQRNWYTAQGNKALSFFGGASVPSGDASNPNGGGMAAGFGTGNGRSGAAAPPSPTRSPMRPGPAGGGGSSMGGFDRTGTPAREAVPTADSTLNDMARNPATQKRDFYEKMRTDPGARPQQQQDYYDYMQGRAGGKTNLETLYNERRAGGDPAAAYEDARATRDINNQLAARGGFNSGAGVRQIGDYYANVGAQRSRDLANLASGADASRLGLDNAYGGAAAGASGEQRGYYSDLGHAAGDASGEQSDFYKDMFGASLGLGKTKADVFTHYSDKGGDAYSQGQLADIEARLAAAGVDAATRKALIGDLTGAAKVALS